MNCRVCGNPLFVGRAVFRCQCGAYTHAHCWEKHVLEAHKPPFVIGTVTMNGDFKPREGGVAENKNPVEKELVTAPRE